jgi:hypothetical protein
MSIARARETNTKRDAVDRAAGFKAPSDGPSDLLLRTAIVAVLAGLTEKDWNAVAEGYCMLVDLHAKAFGVPYDPRRPQ